MSTAAPRKFETPAIPPEFIVKRPHANGKEFITANGLIYLGHLQGLKRVEVQVLVMPTQDMPVAVVRCEVETDLGVFSDYGEVSPANRGNIGGQYPLSLATTRARNRALRIATGCPLTSYEEMGMEAEAANAHAVQTPTVTDPTRNGDARPPAPPARNVNQVRAEMQDLLASITALDPDFALGPEPTTLKEARSVVDTLRGTLADLRTTHEPAF